MSSVLDPRAASRLMQLGPSVASATASVAPTAQRWKAFVSVLTMLGQNQMVQLLVSAAVMGGVYKMQSLFALFWARFKRLFRVTVRLQNRDKEIYDAVVGFIANQQKVRSATLLAERMKDRRTWKERVKAHFAGKRTRPNLALKPDNDHAAYTFLYRGRRIIMHRKRGETITTGHDRRPLDQEEMTLTTWGWSHSTLEKLLEEAIDTDFKEEETDEMAIWVRNPQMWWVGGWEKAVSKPRRKLDSVVMDENLQKELLADMKKFSSDPQYYTDLGIPYRRGYLFFGPPGNGKTSFCQALAGELGLDIAMLQLSDATLDDNSLAQCLREAPENCIIMIEDVDAAFRGRDAAMGDGSSSQSGKSGGISFSGLLNALDGAASQEGRILIMTTNHKEKLDPALIRPGRADVHREICNANASQAERMFLRFFDEVADDALVASGAKRYAAAFPSTGDISMAQVQGHLQKFRGADQIEAAVASVSNLGRIADAEGASAKVGASVQSSMGVYELLNRVGLGHWAAGFEHHGLLDRASLRRAVTQKDGLSVSTVLSWYPELGMDAEERGRMEMLLKELGGAAKDWRLLAQAKLVTREIIKDAAAMHCGVMTMARAGSAGVETAGATRSMESTLALGDRSRELGLALCDVLFDDNACHNDVLASEVTGAPKRGRGLCSEWQLRNFLSMHSVASVDCDTPIACLAAAAVDALLTPRPTDDAHCKYDPLSTYEWLSRCGGQGLARLAYGLEEEGFETACKLVSAGAQLLGKQKDKGKELMRRLRASEQEWDVLTGSLDYKTAPPPLLRDFVCPHRRRLLHEFGKRYYQGAAAAADPPMDPSLASELVNALCFSDGRGRVPLQALTEHFAAHDTAEDAVSSASKLLTLERAPRVEEKPAPPPPETFVSAWLARIGMKELSRGFAEQKLETEEDLRGLVKEVMIVSSPDGNGGEGDEQPPVATTRQIVETKLLEKLAPTVGEQGRLSRALLLECASSNGQPSGTAAGASAQKLEQLSVVETMADGAAAAPSA